MLNRTVSTTGSIKALQDELELQPELLSVAELHALHAHFACEVSLLKLDKQKLEVAWLANHSSYNNHYDAMVELIVRCQHVPGSYLYHLLGEIHGVACDLTDAEEVVFHYHQTREKLKTNIKNINMINRLLAPKECGEAIVIYPPSQQGFFADRVVQQKQVPKENKRWWQRFKR